MSNMFLKVDKDLFNLGLNPTEILIYAQVAEFNRTTGDCFMSDKAFAEMLGVSDKTVSRALKALEDKSLITRETKNIKGGKTRHIHINNRQNVPCETEITKTTTDKMSLVQQTNCPLYNGQNDLIKDNIKENIIKEKEKSNIEMIHNLSNSDGSFKM